MHTDKLPRNGYINVLSSKASTGKYSHCICCLWWTVTIVVMTELSQTLLYKSPSHHLLDQGDSKDWKQIWHEIIFTKIHCKVLAIISLLQRKITYFHSVIFLLANLELLTSYSHHKNVNDLTTGKSVLLHNCPLPNPSVSADANK